MMQFDSLEKKRMKATLTIETFFPQWQFCRLWEYDNVITKELMTKQSAKQKRNLSMKFNEGLQGLQRYNIFVLKIIFYP